VETALFVLDLTVCLIKDGIAGANDKKRDKALRKISLSGVSIIDSSLFLKGEGL
jgi:hypothetical protein